MENEKRQILINHIEKHIRHNKGRENCGFEWDKNNAEVYRIALAALNSEHHRSLGHREFLLLSADQVQREYAEALGCAGDNESILEAIDDMKKRIAELEARTVTLEPFRSFVTDADITALHRFAECCDDPESGGHDLEKEQVRRLEAIGALQRSGRISYITGFGDVLISITSGIGKGE